jgi:uncharacterized protein YndB with AHSA1/START domain
MSKKKNKKAAKNSVSKKKTTKSKSSKKETKKNKIVKKKTPKKVKAVASKKKVVAKKKVVKPIPAKKKSVKPAPKKVTAKKIVPTKKATKSVVKAKAVVIKKQAVEKLPKPSKIAVKKAEPGKNLKPIFQPAKKTNNVKFQDEIPDPPGKFELEYTIHTSTPILFDFLTTPPGLSEWFCDDVDIRNGIYSFKWDEVPQPARLVKMIEESVVRYQWLEKKDNTYFEFRIERDDLTNDISLIVADFADTHEDKISSTLLWNSQIEKLLHVLGSF